MKKIIILSVLLVLSFSSIFAQEGELLDSTKFPEMIFEYTDWDFGTIQKGADCTYNFVFKNTGKSDLVITNVKSSCGCTAPSYTKEPVKKNDNGTISVKYDSNRIGSFHKTVTVYSNAKNSPVVISIKGKVEDIPVQETGSEK
jgi:hypothetical protein